jgi:hypothetical protein
MRTRALEVSHMIQIGYFSEFKGAPAVVLAVDAADFNTLADALLGVGPEEVDIVAALRNAGHQVHLANLSGLKTAAHAGRTALCSGRSIWMPGARRF